MKRFFKKLMENTFYRIICLVLIPTMIAVLFAGIVAVIYHTNYKELLKTSYLSDLEAVSVYNENSMQNISRIMDFLQEDKIFLQTIMGNDGSAEAIKHVEELFDQVKISNEIVDSIVLVERKSQRVYGTVDAQSMETFFNTSYVYKDYDYDYWNSYHAVFSQKHILSPCQVEKIDGTRKNIIPIVYNKIGDKSFGNIIVVNVKMSSLTSSMDRMLQNGHGQIKMFSLSKQNLFSIDEPIEETVSSDFAAQILALQKTTFDYEIGGEKCLVLSFAPKRSVLGYAYVAIIPYKDINHLNYKILWWIAIIGIILSLLIFKSAIFSSKKIFNPIQKLLSVFTAQDNKQDKSLSNNVLERLHTLIQDTVDVNAKMKEEKLQSLPLLQEWYLVNMLNSNNSLALDKERVQKIEFEHDWFCSIVIQFQPTRFFYENFSSTEYNLIRKGIYDIVMGSFIQYYKTYIISSERNTIYVLLNLQSNEEMSNIKRISNQIQDAFCYDKDYINVTIGIGQIYQKIEGLLHSHQEALEIINSSNDFAKIRIYPEISVGSTNETFRFSVVEENELYNYLFSNQTEEAITLVNNVVKKNLKRNLSETELAQLYMQFFNVCFKVMRNRGISYDEKNIGDFAIINALTTAPAEEINSKLIHMIRELGANNGQQVKFSTIIEYIQRHFAEDLHLNMLAEMFGISPKYLSKRLKEELNENFIDYLTTLRINRAIKELKTDKSITEIYSSVGFNNRNTFNRIFKAKTGLTPSEYRKRMKK